MRTGVLAILAVLVLIMVSSGGCPGELDSVTPAQLTASTGIDALEDSSTPAAIGVMAVNGPMYALRISSTEGGSVTWPAEGKTLPYPAGRVVRLVAAPDDGYRFHKWSGNGAQTITDVYAASTTIVISTWSIITAHFVPEGVVLKCNLTVDSTTGGSVTAPGEGTVTYDEGTVVKLIAEPEQGYQFVGWTGDVGTVADVAAASTTITMRDTFYVTASFERVATFGWYALKVSSTEGGSVTRPGEGTFPYAAGGVVRLVAVADRGYQFVEWTGDTEAIADVSAASTTITIAHWTTITAHFVPKKVLEYDLTVDSTTGGSVTAPGQGTFTFDEGQVVNLVAQPEEGYRFVNWTGDVGAIDDVNAASTTITMRSSFSISANFERHSRAAFAWYALKVSSTEGGSVTRPREGTLPYAAGRVVRLVATPADGYRFVEWTGDVGTIADVNAASTTITIQGWYRITAVFERG